MKNHRMIGTKVNYVKKEVDKCEHCRDTCAGDSGKTIYIPRVRFHKNPPIDIKTMPRQSVSNHEYLDNILTNNGDLLVMVIFNFWYHFSFYNISVELNFCFSDIPIVDCLLSTSYDLPSTVWHLGHFGTSWDDLRCFGTIWDVFWTFLDNLLHFGMFFFVLF